jgi:hypothetical protein
MSRTLANALTTTIGLWTENGRQEVLFLRAVGSLHPTRFESPPCSQQASPILPPTASAEPGSPCRHYSGADVGRGALDGGEGGGGENEVLAGLCSVRSGE